MQKTWVVKKDNNGLITNCICPVCDFDSTLALPAKFKYCPNCGTCLTPKKIFCYNCRKDVDWYYEETIYTIQGVKVLCKSMICKKCGEEITDLQTIDRNLEKIMQERNKASTND